MENGWYADNSFGFGGRGNRVIKFWFCGLVRDKSKPCAHRSKKEAHACLEAYQTLEREEELKYGPR